MTTNTPKEQAESEATDLFRCIIFHVPSIAQSAFPKNTLHGDDASIVYTLTHPYSYGDEDYDIEIEIAVTNTVVRRTAKPVTTTPSGHPRCLHISGSDQCTSPAAHEGPHTL